MVFFSCEFTFKTKACNAPLYEKPRSLKVWRYTTRLIYLNGYLDYITEVTMTDKIGGTKINEILLNIIPDSWSKQSYIQGFYCESISF